MARGWESKSVEEQQAAAPAAHEWKRPLTPEEKAVRQQLEALQLSRKRILQQIEAARNPRHRQVLENALADLDSRLARLV